MLLWLFVLLSMRVMMAAARPNVVFIMADDLGWNDIQWHNSEIPTPTLQVLATDHGVILDQAYVSSTCSPTRAALFTGYYPYHTGTQSGIFKALEPTGVPLWATFFTEELQKAELGYKTYAVGKWHMGYCNSQFVATGRGFDEFYGYYSGGGDYYTHRIKVQIPGRIPLIVAETRTAAFDFWDNFNADFDAIGTYSTEIFAAKAIEMINEHDINDPMFLYLAFQAPHTPLEVPSTYLTKCEHLTGDRKTYCGMVYAMDVAIADVVAALKAKGGNEDFYENTIIIFSNDNGAAEFEVVDDQKVPAAGSNLPLRGGKGSLWDGGTRAVSFVHSKNHIKAPGIRTSMFNIVDWYATILTAAGQPTETRDSINQWEMISEGTNLNKRTQMVYNIDTYASAIRKDNYKLIEKVPAAAIKNDGSYDSADVNYLLYDLEEDPNETKSITRRKSDVTSELKALLAELKESTVESIHISTPDPRGSPDLFGNTLASGWCTA